MNNLFGLFHRDGSLVERALLGRMARAAPGKPSGDSAGWCHENIALGVLSHPTTPEAKFEILPLVHSSNAYVLTSGARLDNRAELYDAFAIPYAERAMTPDSALILRAHEKLLDGRSFSSRESFTLDVCLERARISAYVFGEHEWVACSTRVTCAK